MVLEKKCSQHVEGGESGDGNQEAFQHSKRKREDDNSQKPGTFSKTIGNFRIQFDFERDIVPFFVPFSQRVVREVLDRKLLRPNIDESGASEGKFFKLDFMNELPPTMFTHSKIKAKDGKSVKIALYDVKSGSIVSDGPMSCMEIKICVLNGEFGSNGDWTTQDFKAKILRPRDGKGPLLKDTSIRLKNGVGCINIKFTDNSRWTRMGCFRLGAMVQSTSNEARITKEAISQPLRVKDSRGEANKKHNPPSLKDDISRLNNIKKGGIIHKQLSGLGIKTVEEFLQADPSLLLQEKNGNISKKLQKAIKHAKTCVPEAPSASLQIQGHYRQALDLPPAQQDFGEASNSKAFNEEMCRELMGGNGDFVIVGSNIVPTELLSGVNSDNGFLDIIQFANDFDFPDP